MTITKTIHEENGSGKVEALISGHNAHVSLYRPLWTEGAKYEVNWSAWGSTVPADARAYAALILAACDEADALNAKMK